MGVGTPDDWSSRCWRVDMFDCVMPTRVGRNGIVFTREGRMNLRNAQFEADPRPLDPLLAHRRPHFSRAYLRHLLKAGEILAMMGLTAVNLAYYQELVAGARKAIGDGQLGDFIAEVKAGWAEGERAAA